MKPDCLAAVSFHRTMPGYAPTPLVPLPGLAGMLGIGSIWVKDESKRFGLNAFKVLGASYAMGKLAARRLGLDPDGFGFEDLRSGTLGDLTFATATDGNHGRAVAWTARRLGCQAVVYLPSATACARVKAVESEGAEAVMVEGTYDEAVRLAAKESSERGWI
ncbi:MAG TPA: pyridoxal-phosphate dependent enzyme, partial [Desulfobacteraceae bacterium]|nr:pyridoxal-phosphate dependent enzyme [Desulfobacteraceae bacterium]